MPGLMLCSCLGRWRALDGASLNRSSVSFFNDGKEHESAKSRWDRAKRRAAKVCACVLQGIWDEMMKFDVL